MRKNLYLILGILFSFSASAQNLINGGGMEAADAEKWTIVGDGTFAVGSATWGATVTDFGTDGVLHLKEEKGTGTQYYIAQAVELEAGSRYDFTFDYHVTKSLKAWCEVYIGTAEPTVADYADGGARGANPLSWADAQNDNLRAGKYTFAFTPENAGTYYYVIKCGTNDDGNFDIAVDNLELNKISVIADFTASSNKYWKNMDLIFTNTSYGAESYSWNFGDESEAVTEANPTHKYAAAGTYTVSLTATRGEAISTKYMEINILDVNETLLGGDMEVADRDLWVEFGANNLAGGTNDQLIWGDTGADRIPSYKPTGFETGGYLTACEDWAMSSMYKIAQAINLKAGVTYSLTLDYAIGTYRRAWFEVFVGTSAPSDVLYEDNMLGESLIPYESEWNGDGGGAAQKFDSDFTVESDGTYFIVIQLRGGDTAETYFNTSIDNIALHDPTGIISTRQQTLTFAQTANEIQLSQEVKTVKMFSIQGQTLLTKNNTNSVNVSDLAQGIYVLQITDNQGAKSAHKIIIR